MEQYLLPCLSKMITGMDCPGCGMQRSLLLLLKGEFQAAFVQYPAIYTLIFFGISVLLHFTDRSRSYAGAIKFLGVLNGIIILLAYFYKLSH